MQERDKRKQEDGVEQSDKATAESANGHSTRKQNIPKEQLHVHPLLVLDFDFQQDDIHGITDGTKQRESIPNQRILRSSIRD
jgi:hypothetical protein